MYPALWCYTEEFHYPKNILCSAYSSSTLTPPPPLLLETTDLFTISMVFAFFRLTFS